MKEMKNAMVKAIEAAFDFGPNRKRISYVRILESALDVVNDFYQHAKGFEYVQLIQLMEIHALVSIGYFYFINFVYALLFIFFCLNSVSWQKTGKRLKSYVRTTWKIKIKMSN